MDEKQSFFVTEEEKLKIAELYKSGYQIEQIAEIVPRSVSSIQNALARQGIDWRQFKHDERRGVVNKKEVKYKYPKVWVPELGKYMYDDTYNKIWDGAMWSSKYGMEIFGKGEDEYWERIK